MVFGLFSKDRAIKRAMKKAQNKLAQSQDRWPALDKLAQQDDDECFYVLLKRFSFISSKQVEDLEEKDWVVSTMISKGERILPPLQKYIMEAEAISYPLRILEGVATLEQATEIIDTLLEQEKPGYTRDPAKKIDVINWLGEYEAMPAADMVERVVPYLADYDENVKAAAVSSIGLRPAPAAAEPLVNALLAPEEESRRLKLNIAEVLAEHEMDLAGRHKEVAELFEDVLTEYKLHRNKLHRKV